MCSELDWALPADLYDELCRTLQIGHGKGEGPDATLNRVFVKNFHIATHSDNFPTLTRDDMDISLESWPTARLMKLVVRPTSRAPSRGSARRPVTTRKPRLS